MLTDAIAGGATLDATDATLMRELQEDGRASMQALADRVGLSRTATRARVQRLLDSGAVRVVGIVHAAVAGMGAIGHVSLAIDGPVRPVLDAAATRDSATFVSQIAGQYAGIVELRARDDAALASEIDWLRERDGIRKLDVFRCVAPVKDAYSVVRRLEPVPLDGIDWRLLQELQLDGRAPYTRLAQLVGLSQAAARARVMRLIDSGTVHISGLVDSSAFGGRASAGVGLRIRGDARAAAERMATMIGVHYAMTGFGRFDVVCGLDATSRDELLAQIEAVRRLPEVRELESWYHLEVVKESYAVDLQEAAAAAAGRR